MSYSANQSQPFVINFPEVLWESSDNDDRLYAWIEFAGLSMHMEAIPAEIRDGLMVIGDSEELSDAIYAAVGAAGHFQTLNIRGREYVLIASPFCT